MDHSTRHPNLSSSSFRRLVLSLGFAVAGVISEAPAEAIAAAAPDKVLRIASPDIDTLDPHQFNDDPSFQVISAIFEGLYEWDYLASTPTLAPVTAAGAPEISADALTWTIRLKPGIYFTDDPAFHGKPRELVAQDFVYSITRWLDPNLRRGGAAVSTDLLVGARAVIDATRVSGKRRCTPMRSRARSPPYGRRISMRLACEAISKSRLFRT